MEYGTGFDLYPRSLFQRNEIRCASLIQAPKHIKKTEPLILFRSVERARKRDQQLEQQRRQSDACDFWRQPEVLQQSLSP